MDLSKWIEKENEEYKKEHPPDFMTHLNYVICFNTISEGLSAECKLDFKKKIYEGKILKKKINLIKLIIKNLQLESENIKTNIGFAEVCVPWIAVKIYYLMFNLFLILEYLISGQESSFNCSHEGLIKSLKGHIERKEIIFNKKMFNSNFQCLKIMNYKAKSGANLKVIGINLGERITQLLKKLISYKLEDFQRKRKIRDYRSKKNRLEKKEFLEYSTVNLFEFFYCYRIKSNYRDLEFLDKDISDEQFSDFYTNYLKIAANYYMTFKTLINCLSKIRLGKALL
ncbi:MAG: hypothetical protein PHI73_03245 [Patescibacteria group bacterium]|nr:hypothetical protein [Patescibacteria group bacterium]